MNRPDVDAVLAPLKPFQRRTVEHAFHRLFLAPDSTARFLVADEVGLGKTLVARGIIARAIDHLWDEVKRIDVIYICSNASIARSNLPKLQIGTGGHRSFALATRLTMLATELAPKEETDEPNLVDSKLNFVSFTPATSFAMGHSQGKGRERMVLFRLLEPLTERHTALMNLLQGTITKKKVWRWKLNHEDIPLEPTIAKDFRKAFRQRKDLRREMEDLLENGFGYYRQQWPWELRQRRNRLISQLRQLLAEVCVQGLQPDLVILDEFQRFKSLLDEREDYRDPATELAQALFRAKTPEGNPVRTLLLSATPYKLYTTDAEIEEENHYEDFIATTRFLMGNDEARVEALKGQLSRFGRALKRAATDHTDEVTEAKRAVESSLKAVMARTERVTASEAHDAMVEEPKVDIRLDRADIEQYLAADALFRAVGDRDPMAFWKSAPYLMHFMHGYRFNERLEEAREYSPGKLLPVLAEHKGALLKADDLHAWSALDPGNAKLRDLARQLLDGGLWQLLWIPPTVPYWDLEGPFAGQARATKTLLFSAWNVVPDVVSGYLSYEAERRMVEGQLQAYENPDAQREPRLRLSQTAAGSRSRHRLFLLLLPATGLADATHPLAAPPGADRREWVRERVMALLVDPSLPDPKEGSVDSRWEWAAPLLLDPGLKGFLQAWKENEALQRPNPEHLSDYLDDFLELDVASLGRRPEHLVDLMTDVALGSPAVLAARTLWSSGIDEATRRELALLVAESFWRLFNRPAVIGLLDRLAEEGHLVDQGENSVYWRQVLRYCTAGNLQAVLDETWHLLWEQQAWSEQDSKEDVARECAARLTELIQPTPSRVHARFFKADGHGRLDNEEMRLRTVFALRFGDIRTEERIITQEAVRNAFNSPFRPFVLTSTSVGQEGLDFHPWCHRLVHWDLPGNPVDLEQREGRVNRYKGHAVRRNVAAAHASRALQAWRIGEDLWTLIFKFANQAAREAGESDLIPYWIATGETRVQRYVPLLPYSREVEAFARLKRQLAAYRVVFGQPRQEELMSLLDQSSLDSRQLREWAIDLTPKIGLDERN